MATHPGPQPLVSAPEDSLLAEAVRRLVEVYRPVRIYLFGSRARGNAAADSDYDFLVVVPDGVPRERLDPVRGYRCLRGLGIAKDVLVWKQSDFEDRLQLKASLPATVAAEGKLLYAA